MDKKYVLILKAGIVSGIALALADYIFLWMLEALIDYAKLGIVLYWAILLIGGFLSALLITRHFKKITSLLDAGMAAGILAGVTERLALLLLVLVRVILWPGSTSITEFVGSIFPDFVYSIISTAITFGIIFAAIFGGLALYRFLKSRL